MIQIINNVLWMPFPKKDIIQSVSQYLNKLYGPNYLVWNLSEHSYDRQYFNNQVVLHQYVGFSSPPIYELLLICKTIFEWVLAGNVAIIHCQANKGRSALVACLLLHYVNNQPLDECRKIVFDMLGLSYQSTKTNQQHLLATQEVYFNYLKRLLLNEQLNPKPLRLKSVILHSLPINLTTFRPIFQIKDRQQVLYEDNNQQIQKGECCVFILPNIIVTQDFIIRCKHIQKDHLLPVFRLQMHTAFMDNAIMRFTQKFIDLQMDVEEEFFIDVITDKIDEQTQGEEVIHKLLNTCEQLSLNLNQLLFEENVISNEYIIQQQTTKQQQQQQQQQQQDNDYDDIII